jgi:hypothetical protein
VKGRSKKAIIILSSKANNCERKRCKKQTTGEHDDKELEVIKQQVASEICCYPPEISVFYTCSYARILWERFPGKHG